MTGLARPRAVERRATAVLVASLLIATACGGDADEATVGPTPAATSIEPTPAAPVESTFESRPTQSPSPTPEPGPTSSELTATSEPAVDPDDISVELVGCEQFASHTGVDADVARAYVPADEELHVDAFGHARVVLITKWCADLRVDDVSAGPGHFNTLWVRVTGPAEVREFPGQLVATDYYVPQFFHTDNASFARPLVAFGVPMNLADSMAADPLGLGTQSGAATDSTYDPPLSYRWKAETGTESGTGLGVAHVLRGVDDEGSALVYDIECSIGSRWPGGSATVEFEAGTELDDLVGTGWSAQAIVVALECTATIEKNSR